MNAMKTPALAILLFASLAGCASAPPPPEPVLTFAAQTACAPSLSVATPADLTPKAPTGAYQVTAPVAAGSACLAAANSQQPYVVFALPTAGKVASVSAGAVIEARRVLPPTVMTLGADGRVMRTFPRADMMQRGRTLSVLFAPQEGERFVAVVVDPSAIGERLSFVSVDPAAAEVPAHLAGPRMSADAYRSGLAAPYSYEGQAFARVYFFDPNPPAPPRPRPTAPPNVM